MLRYPPKVSAKPKARVRKVENQTLVTTRPAREVGTVTSPVSLSSKKNSWKEVRAIRATASREVSANADTFMVMKTVATVLSKLIAVIPRAMPAAKIWKGVLATPALRAPVPAVFMSPNMMPATTMARTPTKDSMTIAPKPTGRASVSLASCLEEVLEDTRLWKPESAPQATETKSTGKM